MRLLVLVAFSVVALGCIPECDVSFSTTEVPVCPGGSVQLVLNSNQSGDFEVRRAGESERLVAGKVTLDFAAAYGSTTIAVAVPETLGRYTFDAVLGQKACPAQTSIIVQACPTLVMRTERAATPTANQFSLGAPASSVSMQRVSASPVQAGPACVVRSAPKANDFFYGVQVRANTGVQQLVSATIDNDYQVTLAGFNVSGDLFDSVSHPHVTVTESALGPQSGSPPVSTLDAPVALGAMAFNGGLDGGPQVSVAAKLPESSRYFVEGVAADGGSFFCEALLDGGAMTFPVFGGVGAPFAALEQESALRPFLLSSSTSYRVGLSTSLAWPPRASRFTISGAEAVTFSGSYVAGLFGDGGVR